MTRIYSNADARQPIVGDDRRAPNVTQNDQSGRSIRRIFLYKNDRPASEESFTSCTISDRPFGITCYSNVLRSSFNRASASIHSIGHQCPFNIRCCSDSCQSYDGANVMSGRLNGVQKIINNSYKNAHFIHCYAQQLNLILIQAT